MNLKLEELVKALRFCGKHECITCPCDIDECSQMVYSAADQIERDQKEIVELREKVPQWISVSEKMPTDHLKRYLISFKDAGGGIVDMARYIHGLGWECNNWEVPQELITHWMPLPEPPKEKSNGEKDT